MIQIVAQTAVNELNKSIIETAKTRIDKGELSTDHLQNEKGNRAITLRKEKCAKYKNHHQHWRQCTQSIVRQRKDVHWQTGCRHQSASKKHGEIKQIR